jgi:uncharacterized protein
MIIDLFEFARQQKSASGEISLATLSRIDTPDRTGLLAWSAHGSLHGRDGTPRLDLTVDGSVALICQRCLQPMTQTIHVVNHFLIADDENAADRLDQDDDYDVVVGSATFDLDTLIEDEVILALPSAPRHRVCPDGADDTPKTIAKPSPFAALAALKGTAQTKKTGQDDS